VALAIVPSYMKLWNGEGRMKTEELLNQTLGFLLFISPILVASLYVISKELFTLMATEEYAKFNYLLPLLTIGTLLSAAMPIYSAGLKLKQASLLMLYCVICSAFINVILNMIFIPKFGLVAAAATTIISYGFIVCSFLYFGSSTLTLTINTKILIRSCAYSFLFVWLASFINTESNITLLALKVFIGCLYFFIMIFFFEKNITSFIMQRLFKRNNQQKSS